MAGAHAASASTMAFRCSFQSSPGPMAGAHGLSPQGVDRGLPFSILARPDGRCAPDLHPATLVLRLFQSSPGPMAGAHVGAELPRSGQVEVSILARPDG